MRHIAQFFALAGALIMMAFGTQANAASPGFAEPDMDYIRVAPSEQMDLREALASDRWQSLEGESPNFGYIRDTVWLRVPVSAIPSDRKLLEIRYPQLDDITFYLIENGVVRQRISTGDHLPFAQRQIQHRNFLFSFETDPLSDYQVFLRVRTQGAMQIPIRLWDPRTYFEATSIEDQMHAIYYGILIMVIFFNLFIFLALRERMYLLYVLSTLSYLMFIGSLNGSTYQLLWPESPWLHNQTMVLTVPVALIFTLLFSRAFLNLRVTSPRMDKLVWYMVLVNVVVAVATFVTDYSVASRLTVALAIPSCLLLTVMGPIQWIRGNPQAGYYTIAWGLLTLGSAITAANKYGFVPNSFVTAYGIEIGSALEAVLLTIALAARLYQEREDKVRAREAEITAMAARRSAELRLIEQALHNPLTGLPNRACLEMTINELINREPEKRLSIAVIHLSNLPAITKTLGHRNTDRLLELAARRFNSIVSELPGICAVETNDRKSFYLASLESATFGFIVEADVISETPRAIVRALEEIRAPLDYLGMQLPLAPHTGSAIYPDHATDTNTLIRRAFIAQGSDDARDRGLAYYQPSRDSYSADRLTLVSELQQALQHGELALYLQPKLSLRTREVVGLEALIRWPGRKKPIPADELIALAEQTGLIKPLTRWVLEQSLALRGQLLENGYPLNISVNISPNNLREPDFPLYVQRLMGSHHTHRGTIILEVTETSMMQDPVNSLRALDSLHTTGIPLSIDDFGSGYSSLSYIKRLPASEIKIDRSLITDLASQAGDRVIVQTTIEMCHSLGYAVVAEGVESAETMELLERMGCDMIQGYILTPPLPFDDIIVWLGDYKHHERNRKLG
ncbi:EAL domain-containing protein [Marinobacter salarius]|uniref:EAL domain-containing protein n=1 Tax=Marinobacter salarius TaxID=1420917 RepID=UPI001D1840F8|nr:EAL domain-containing protein [Marinobacter salarius]MCC4283430.1 EAL domain-containing protein [Marinobacter salarius]MDP4531352.1 EAL domain-containing protein [Marinobacter salarius]